MSDPATAPAAAEDQTAKVTTHDTPLPVPTDPASDTAAPTDATGSNATGSNTTGTDAPSEDFAAAVLDTDTTATNAGDTGAARSDTDAAAESTDTSPTDATSATDGAPKDTTPTGSGATEDAPPPGIAAPSTGSKVAPEDPAPATSHATAHAAPPPPAKSGFFPLVLGGVIAAGIGFGAAQFLGPMGARTADLQAQLADLDGRLTLLSGEMTTRIAEMPAAATDAALTELAPQLDALSARLDEQDTRLSALSNRDDLEAQITDALAGIEPRVTDQVAATLADPLADLQSLRDDIAARQDGLRSDIESLRALAETRVADAEAEAAAAANRAARTAARLALTDLASAFDSGAAFDTVLPQIATADVDIPPALSEAAQTGVPTLAALQDSFTGAARRALSESLQSVEAGSVTDRVALFLRSQTNARSLSAREGDDPDAVLSRAEAALRAGQVDEAITELDALPDAGRAAMADWIAEARLRADAADGLNALQNQLTAE